MSDGDPGKEPAFAVRPGFVDLFPELEEGTDLGVVEYFAPGTESSFDLIGDTEPGVA